MDLESILSEVQSWPAKDSRIAKSFSHWEKVAEDRVRVLRLIAGNPHPPLRGTFSRGEKDRQCNSPAFDTSAQTFST